MFADRALIWIRSGKGGDGHVSFRREKYVAAGGPDGGDGGDGGSIIFEIDEGLNTLASFRHRRKFSAANGQEGGKKRCHGKAGEDLILKVPEGTVIYENKTKKVIADMSGPNRRQVILKGGRGGKGNMNYATSTMQIPRYAQPGQSAKELEIRLELKLIADVALVGFPNAGKSTFLRRVSNAQPKVADYPFTTLIPNLGVVDLEGAGGFVIADIPGLIEGASEGAGLGIEFLRHIERTRLILHIVDAASLEGRDPVEDVRKINQELAKYKETLRSCPQIIAANKIDLMGDDQEKADLVRRLQAAFGDSGTPVFAISAATGEGVRELLYELQKQLDQLPKETRVFEREYDPEIELKEDILPHTVQKDPSDPHTFVIEGPRIEKMLGYTNLDSEKGFAFFQKFLQDSGILDELIEAGVEEGDTIRMYGHSFEYYA